MDRRLLSQPPLDSREGGQEVPAAQRVARKRFEGDVADDRVAGQPFVCRHGWHGGLHAGPVLGRRLHDPAGRHRGPGRELEVRDEPVFVGKARVRLAEELGDIGAPIPVDPVLEIDCPSLRRDNREPGKSTFAAAPPLDVEGAAVDPVQRIDLEAQRTVAVHGRGRQTVAKRLPHLVQARRKRTVEALFRAGVEHERPHRLTLGGVQPCELMLQ
jgi:hypothetical protein